MTTLSEALRELLKYPFDIRGKWLPIWTNARAALAALDAQQGVNPELPKERIEAAAYSLGMRYAIRRFGEPMSTDQLHELVKDSNLDWARGWALEGGPNRYEDLVRRVEFHHGIAARVHPAAEPRSTK